MISINTETVKKIVIINYIKIIYFIMLTLA